MASSWQVAPVSETSRTSTVQRRSSDKRRLEIYNNQKRAAEIAIASLLNPTLSAEALVAGNAVGLAGEDPLFQELAAREQEQTGWLGSAANAFDEAWWDPLKGAARWLGMAWEGAIDEVWSRPLRVATNMKSYDMGLEEAYAESGGAFMGGFGESVERTWDALGEGKFSEALGFSGKVTSQGEGIFAASDLAPEVQFQLAAIDANGETVGTDRDLTADWGMANYGSNFAKLNAEQRKMMYLSTERDRIYQEASTEGTELYGKQQVYGDPYVDAHKREAESVLLYTKEMAWKRGQSGMGTFSQVSPGRVIANIVTEPGTSPYHWLSGFIDLGIQIFGDPADVGLRAAGKVAKGTRALGVSSDAIKAAQDNARVMDTIRDTLRGLETTELAELTAKAPATQKYAAQLAGEADVVGRSSIAKGRIELQKLGRARDEANKLNEELQELLKLPDLSAVVKREMGLLEGAARKDVDSFQVSKWITGRTAVPFVDNFVRANTIRQVDALLSYVKVPIPRKLRQALVEADTNAEVVGLLLPHVGNVITESGLALVPSITGGKLSSPTGLLARGMLLINPTVSARETAFYASQGFRANNKMAYGGSALARRFALVAPSTLDLNDLDRAYGDLNLMSENLGITAGEVLTYKYRGKEITESLDDIMGDFINVRDGDFVGAYDVLSRYMRYSFESLTKSGIEDSVAEALIRFTGTMKDDALWFTNRVGDIVREPNVASRVSVGTTEVINPGPQLITELFNGTVMFPDHNLIRRAVNDTDRFGRIMNNLALRGNPFRGIPGVKYTKSEVEDFNQRWALRMADSILSTVWKPLVLLRFAWPFRVIGEEQIRLSAAGLGGMFTIAPGSGHHPLSYIAMALGDVGRKDGDIALRHLSVLGDDITKAEEFIAMQSRRVNFDGQIGAKGDRYWTTAQKYDASGSVSSTYLDGLSTELNQLWSDPTVQRLFLDDDVLFAGRRGALTAPSAPPRPVKGPTRLRDATEAPRKLGPQSGLPGFDDRPAVMPMDDLLDMREFDRAATAASPKEGFARQEDAKDTIQYWRDRFEGKTPDEIFNELGEADLPILAIDRHGNVMLIEGNHRIAAAKEAGMTEFPVRMVTMREGDLWQRRAQITAVQKKPPEMDAMDVVTPEGYKNVHLDDIQPGAWENLQKQYPGFKTGDYIPADISPGDVFAPVKVTPTRAIDEASLSDEVLERLEFHREQLDDLEIERAQGEHEGYFLKNRQQADDMDADITGNFELDELDITEISDQIAYHKAKVEEITNIKPTDVEPPTIARGGPSVPIEAPLAGAGTTFGKAPGVPDQDRIAATAEWLRSGEGTYWLRELTRTAPDEYRVLLDTDEGLIRYLEGVYARAHLKAGGEYRFLLGDGTYVDDLGNPGRLTPQEMKQYGNQEGYVITRQGDQRILDAYATGKLQGVDDKPLNVRRRFTGSDVKRTDAISEARTLTDIRKVKQQLRRIVDDELNAGVQFPDAVKTNRYLQDDVNSISTGYDNAVNRLFDWFMSRPTNRLSRSPAFRSSYWQRMGDLMAHMDDSLKADVLAAAQKAKMDTIMMGRRGSTRRGVRQAAGKGVEGAAITTLEEADQLAKAYALTEVQDILYDLSKKHNISEAMSIIFPFIEAYGEVSSTWAKLMTQQWGRPFRRYQQVIESGRESNPFDPESGYTNEGFFHQDQFDNEVFSASFAIPFIGQLSIGQMKGEFNYSLEGMNFLASVIPGFGPALQIPANLFLPQDARWDHIRELISPFGGTDGNIVSSSLPSYMKRAFMGFDAGRSLLGTDKDQAMFENTVVDIMRAYAIADPQGFQEAMGDPIENEKLLSRARSDARNLYLIRSIATYLGPTSPSFTPMVEDKNGTMWAYNALGSMYRTLKEEAGGDDLKATERFDELFGLDGGVALAVGKTREILPRSTIKIGNQFQRNQPLLFRQYPATAFYLGPARLEDYGDFFYPAWYQAIVEGARENLNQAEWTGLLNDFYGEVAYDTAVRRVMETEGVADKKHLSDAGKNSLRDYNIKLQNDFPGYQYSFGANITGVPSRVELSEQITQITKMTKDSGLVDTYEAVEGARAYLAMRDAALPIMRGLGFASLTSSQDDKAVAVRNWLRTQGEQYADLFPDFAPMWDDIFMREIEEPRDTVDYDLALQQIAGSG